jgi:2-haloacid dehalogenase
MATKYQAVLFDLLTGLLDSWTLWNAVAGNAELGRRWRAAYLEMTYRAGVYRPYEGLIAEAAISVGLPALAAEHLAARYGEVRPWPEVAEVLTALRMGGVPLAVVTNCSEALAQVAVARLGVPIDIVVTAERAGVFKPEPGAYRMALDLLGAPAEKCLFVAGSPYDIIGTHALGLPTYWHDRIGLAPPPGMPPPSAHHRTLLPLLSFIFQEYHDARP